MMILVSGATKTVNRLLPNENLGVLLAPHDWRTLPKGCVWAADNAAYSNWDENKFIVMLDKIKKHDHKPIFVACPDVVGDAVETDKRFRYWQPKIKAMGLPVALVLQNGIEWYGVNWNKVDAVFVGGDNDFKLGKYVRYIVPQAKRYGKWVHMGRVNSIKRMAYAKDIGCDSIDGTGFSMFPDTYIPKYLKMLKKDQLRLFDI